MKTKDLVKFDEIIVYWYDSMSYAEWQEMDKIDMIVARKEDLIITRGSYAGENDDYISVLQNSDFKNKVGSHLIKIFKKSISKIDKR